jgi:hypothetical protein
MRRRGSTVRQRNDRSAKLSKGARPGPIGQVLGSHL